MKQTFNEMIVFITGGASGLGLETARQLAARGADIVIFNRGADAAKAAIREIEAARHDPRQRVGSVLLDVARRDQVLAGLDEAARRFGVPDMIIHMAGSGGLAPMRDMDFEAFDRIIQANLYGTRHVAEAALAMWRGRPGRLVLAGSLGGYIPVYGYTAYGTSKFAVVGFAQCLRCELRPRGIEVQCFCPGEVMTPGLREERAATHPAALAIKSLGGTLRCEDAVRGLLRGIKAHRFLIIPGWRSKAVYWAARLTPVPLWNLVTDLIVRWALSRGAIPIEKGSP